MGRHKRNHLNAERAANAAKRFEALGALLERRSGVLLAGDPRLVEVIADMRRELNSLRAHGRRSDFVEGDLCMVHPAKASLTACGDTYLDRNAVTHEAHLVSCATCLRAMANAFATMNGATVAARA